MKIRNNEFSDPGGRTEELLPESYKKRWIIVIRGLLHVSQNS
jgi:hypothetical protein